MIIRPESHSDIAAITRVTEAAFADKAYSSHTESFIIRALRAANVLAVSLVADENAEVVGHIAFSPVTLSDGSGGWYGLGPVSVLPERQKQGIGTALIETGLSSLRTLGASGCVLLGDPNYYKRFGFANNLGLILEGVPQEYFLALPFEEHVPEGVVRFHPGFEARE